MSRPSDPNAAGTWTEGYDAALRDRAEGRLPQHPVGSRPKTEFLKGYREGWIDGLRRRESVR